jgi:para-aminobenzoate synthetase component 1
MRNYKKFPIPKNNDQYNAFLNWADSTDKHYIFLNSNNYQNDDYSKFDALLAVGLFDHICPAQGIDAFEELKIFVSKFENDWKLGFLSYDIKNQLENLSSKNDDNLEMPLMHFFVPLVIFIFKDNAVEIGIRNNDSTNFDHNSVFKKISEITPSQHLNNPTIEILHKVTKADYIKNIREIKNHIRKGNIYETNYCIEFFAENNDLDPLISYHNLNNYNPAPFACFYRLNDKYLISSSPERFLAKRKQHLISQPIKGTIKRGNSPDEDLRFKEKLSNDPKERSENIMIVDLVRNDLSCTSKTGTVAVKELCKIYSYPSLHQMISTITSEVREDIHFIDSIRMAFPMGSMTGAPKISAMQIIEEFENTKRGLYSGSVGYIDPKNDFDFNVIIRSVLYNKSNRYLSFMAGSAITIGSDPEKEYNECLLKAAAMAKILGSHL